MEKHRITLTDEDLRHIEEALLIKEGFAPLPRVENEDEYWEAHVRVSAKIEKVIYKNKTNNIITIIY